MAFLCTIHEVRDERGRGGGGAGEGPGTYTEYTYRESINNEIDY